MSIKVVHSGSGVIKVNVDSTPAISVKSPEVGVISVNPNVQGTAIGATGAQGPQGAAGSDGVGVPDGGEEYQLVRKGNGDTTEWAFADRVFIAARFSEDVSEGDPVYVSGFHGSNGPVIVSKADASDSSKMPAIGLAIQDYSQNNEGDVACIGSLKDVDTDSFSVGDVLYVASGGGLTSTKPTGTDLIQNVGKVGRSNQNNGEIVVMAIGRSNDVPNIAQGKAWVGNSSGVAEPTSLADVAITGSYNSLSDQPTINNNVTTDISVSYGTDTVTVESSDGTDGIIEEASATKAGVMSSAQRNKLEGIEANADVTDSTSVGNAGAVMDADFSSQGLMHRNASSGSYTVFTGGQGIELDGTNSEVKVNVDSEINAYDSTDDVVVKITGPSGVEDDGITLRPSGPITIDPATNVITFTVDDDLSNYDNTTTQFINYTNLSGSGSVSGITLNHNSGAFTLTGPISLTSGDIPDLSSTYHQDLSVGATTATTVRVDISDGTNAVIPAATSTEAGLLTATDKGVVDKAITDDDFSTNGILRRTAAQTYDANGSLNELANVTIANPAHGHLLIGDSSGNFSNQALSLTRITASSTGQNLTLAADEYTGGTGIDVDGSQVISVNTDTTINTATAGDDATITVQGPSGNSDSITLVAGSNVTLTETGDQITIATNSGTMSEVVDDDSPTLGGNLDVGGYDIVSTNAGNIDIIPHTTGEINLGDGNTVNVDGDLKLRDDDELILGNNSDLRIYHDSLPDSDSIVAAKNDLVLDSSTEVRVKMGSDTQIKAVADGAVELSHNGSVKLSTASTGANVTGSTSTTKYFLGHVGTITDISDASLSSAGKASGCEILKDFYDSPGSVTAGKIYQAGSSDWGLADKDAAANARGLLAIATSDANGNYMVTRGSIRLASIAGTQAKGGIVYLGDDGNATMTAPATDGMILRIIGYSYGSNNKIFFNPSPDFIEIA